MPTLNVNYNQVVELIRQMPEQDRRGILLELASESQAGRAKRENKAQNAARRLSAEQGLNWDNLDEEARIVFPRRCRSRTKTMQIKAVYDTNILISAIVFAARPGNVSNWRVRGALKG